VYEHIATADPKFKDIREKIELLKKAGEGAVFGTIGKKTNDAAVVVDGLGQNTTLGRYEIVKELGRGAMGIVYLGKDPKINRQVAVKTLRFEEELDEDQTKSIKDRFFREAESAGNLTHPNIIRIFDAGEDQDVAYIAMELLDGEDLKKYTEKATLLPEERAVEIIMQVAFGLDYAHKQGVVHRDIKPANIMLLKDGTLRITDFGIARIQATSKTATGAVLGTPAYMSPEQVNGKKVDGRADVFSLGVTMYEMLTGEKPFVADSIAALLYRIANVDHPDPREFNSAVSVRLLPIINKALAKDPDDRYQTAGELGDDLRIFLQGGIPKATPPPPPEPAIKPVEPQIEPGIEEINVVPPVIDEKQKFLTELQEAFKIPGGEPFSLVDDIFTRPEDESKNSAPEPEPDGGDPVIIPPSENPDRTVVLDPDKGPADLDRNVD
jgi:serine/threonine-protein kinase